MLTSSITYSIWTIHEVSLLKFLDGKRLIIDNGYDIKYDPKETVKRARSKIGTNKEKYNLILHNCEHFATWCRTGFALSKQVKKVGNKLKFIGFVGGGLVVGKGISILIDSITTSDEDF